MHIHLLLIHTSHFYCGRTTKIILLMCKVLASSTLERGQRDSSCLKSLVKIENFISHSLFIGFVSDES
jgi:hypothetical protein